MEASQQGSTLSDKEIAHELVFLDVLHTGTDISQDGCESWLFNILELDEAAVTAFCVVIRMHGTKWFGDHND